MSDKKEKALPKWFQVLQLRELCHPDVTNGILQQGEEFSKEEEGVTWPIKSAKNCQISKVMPNIKTVLG